MRHKAAFQDNTSSYIMTNLPDVGAQCVALYIVDPKWKAKQLWYKPRLCDKVYNEKVLKGTVVADPIVK